MNKVHSTARAKNPTSLRKVCAGMRKGWMRHIVPETTIVMKAAAPSNSPIANDPEPACRAEKVAKTSGDPFEKAKRVHPA